MSLPRNGTRFWAATSFAEELAWDTADTSVASVIILVGCRDMGPDNDLQIAAAGFIKPAHHFLGPLSVRESRGKPVAGRM